MTDKTKTEQTRGRKPLDLTPGILADLRADIDDIIAECCERQGIAVADIKPTNWLYCINQIRLRIFRQRPELIHEYNDTKHDWSGQLSQENVSVMYELYKDLVYTHNMIVSQKAFFDMLDMGTGSPWYWEKRGEVTSRNAGILKTIRQDREESLANAMLSTRDNPVKYLAIGNHEFAWNEKRQEEKQDSRRALTLADLPEYKLETRQKELSENLGIPDFSADD